MKTSRPASSHLVSAGALALLSAIVPLARSATLTWDPGATPTSPTGSSGTWNTTTAQWSNGSTDQVWSTSNTNPDIANFPNPVSAYTVTLNTAVYAGGLSLTSTTNAVTLSGTGSVTLTGSAPTISVVGGQMSLNAAIQGSAGYEKTGSGVLRIGVAGNYSGDTKLSAGQITSDVNNALSTSGKLTMTGTTFFSLAGKNQSVAGLTGTSGATVRATSGTGIFTVTAGTGTFAGTINDGTGTARLNFVNSGGSLTLTGSNNHRGTTEISGGTLTLGSSLFNASNSTGTSSVTVSGGTLASSVASIKLGVGDFSMSSGALSANGGSIGSYTLAANKNFFASGGTLNFTLGTGNTSDAIFGSGTGIFSLTGVTLSVDGLTSVAGNYTLFSGFSNGTNVVSGLTITGLDAGFTGVLGTDGVLTVSTIPEPSSCAALLGLVALGFATRRRAARR